MSFLFPFLRVFFDGISTSPSGAFLLSSVGNLSASRHGGHHHAVVQPPLPDPAAGGLVVPLLQSVWSSGGTALGVVGELHRFLFVYF
jgi:hypothetical protein